MRAGIFALAAALVVAIVLARTGAEPGYRALAFLPFFVAAHGVLGSLYGVCGFTALAGRRMTEAGAERVCDFAELSEQRKSGLRVAAMSMTLAAIATTLFVIAN